MFGLVPWRKEREVLMPAENPLAALSNEFRALYSRFFPDWPLLKEFEPERLWNVDVMETEKEMLIRMEVPGFEPEDFHLDLRGDRLHVKAEHTTPAKEVKEPTEVKEPNEAKELKPAVEKRVRRYERVFTLPEGVALEKVEACYHSGVLEVRLPRVEEAVGRRIPVRGG